MKAVKMSISGRWDPTKPFLKKSRLTTMKGILEQYAKKGVDALASNTPKDTGLTASSWSYKIFVSEGYASINWTNSNRVGGVPIALILQYGHATRNGGWVEGIDYINPSLKPVFDDIVENVWKEVLNNG